MCSEDWAVVGGITLLILFIVGCFCGLLYEENRADTYNRNFSDRCYAAKGNPVITDKDLCIRDGKILFHE